MNGDAAALMNDFCLIKFYLHRRVELSLSNFMVKDLKL